MINFFLICMMSIYVCAVDIEGLKKEKIDYKKYHILNKKQPTNQNRIVIVFKKEFTSEMAIINKKYHFILEQCLVKTVCVFHKDEKWKLYNNLDKMKSDIGNIEEIKFYKRGQFSLY